MRQALGLLTAAGLLAGCALPAHNNTMIFATKTDVGLGVSTPSATDAGVSVTLGYKERRAAWVPLWANGPGNQPFGCQDVWKLNNAASEAEQKSYADKISCKHGPKLIGDDDAGGGKGSNAANDAYSTFASFGGDFVAGGKGGASAEAQVKGTLASFFATGVAAQSLAKHPTLVNTAGKEADRSNGKVEDPAAALLGFLTDTRLPEADKGLVRQTCITRLVGLAQLDADAGKKVQGISPSPPKAWLNALLGLRDELGDGLTVMNFMAAKLKAERDGLLKDETMSAKAATDKVCPPAG